MGEEGEKSSDMGWEGSRKWEGKEGDGKGKGKERRDVWERSVWSQ